MNDWFAAKRFGYGAGMPIAWQGWAVLGGYLALVAAIVAAVSRHRHPVVQVALLIIVTAGMALLTAQHTRGGWRWRWGDRG